MTIDYAAIVEQSKDIQEYFSFEPSIENLESELCLARMKDEETEALQDMGFSELYFD